MIELERNTYAAKLLEKIYRSGQPPVKIALARRALATAMSVLRNIEGMSFEDVSYQSARHSGWSRLAQLFQGQMELASLEPEKFIKGLRSFFMKTGNFVKKEGLGKEFFELYRKIRLSATEERDNENNSPEITGVSAAFLCLMLECTEYIRHDNLKLEQMPCGVTTDGQIMTVTDPYARIDFPQIELDQLQPGETSAEKMAGAFLKYGYTGIRTFEDMEILQLTSRFFSNQVAALSGYISEYSYDMLPEKPVNVSALTMSNLPCVQAVEAELAVSPQEFSIRRRSLPVGGVICRLSGFNSEVSLKLKETVIEEDRTVVLLYKLRIGIGDFCGYFNTKTAEFYSIISEYDVSKADPVGINTGLKLRKYLMSSIENIVLTNYAVCVLDRDRYTPEWMSSALISLLASGYSRIRSEITVIGGKPKDYYAETEFGKSRKDSPLYAQEDRYVAGHTMKLPPGRKASEEALEYAREYGYELEPGYTYVRPFIKEVLVKKP